MKKSDELKQKRHALMGELKDLPNAGLETREFETRENELTEEIHNLSGEILKVEREEKERIEKASRQGTVIHRGNNDLEKYSFTRALRVALGYDKGGIEEEMNQEARREMNQFGGNIRGFGIPAVILNRSSSGQNYTTPGDGGYLTGPGGNMQFYTALRNRLTLTKLGATFIPNLTGTLPLVGGGTFTAAWKNEGEEITKSKTSFADRGTLRPRRLGSLGAISKELIYSSLPDVERIIVNELADSIAQAIETAAINGSGTGATPTGILNYVGIGSVVGGENGASPSWAKVVELETAVLSANGHGEKMGYLTNSAVAGKLKTTVKTDTEQFIMDGNTLNGYPAQVTNAVPSTLDKGNSTGVCSAVIFGAWEHLIVGSWGGLDIIVDPYTRKAFGEIELNTNQFIDLGLSNPARFAAFKDVLTS
ncbi:phage major capsid protein [Mariniphaga sp.]|uniref:phage major capsid protein n=1 Tax=Mariniphaga sp. TaxID=1954475 RepID=UPI003561A212